MPGGEIREENFVQFNLEQYSVSYCYSPSAESRKFGFMAHSKGTAETCHALIIIFDY